MIRVTRSGKAILLTDAPKPIYWTRRRIALTIGGLIIAPFLAIFLIGATVGIYKGITENSAPELPATVQAQLHTAQANSKTPCWAEFNDQEPNHFEVLCGGNTVTDFNDGFADSKKDDCDQGFQKACDWIADTK
jgi:hypothetical protein